MFEKRKLSTAHWIALIITAALVVIARNGLPYHW